MFRHLDFGQNVSAARLSDSTGKKSEAIRKAATEFLRSLTPDRRERVTFVFPKWQSPTAVGFGPMPDRTAAFGRQKHDVSFDTDSNPTPDLGPSGPTLAAIITALRRQLARNMDKRCGPISPSISFLSRGYAWETVPPPSATLLTIC